MLSFWSKPLLRVNAIDTATPHFCSLAANQLCGLDRFGNGTYTADGITKLCEGLKGSAVTSLECAATSCSLLCQRPLTRPYSLTVSILPLACSLGGNDIGDEAVTALAAVLKETQITNLKCATPPSVRFYVSAR